MSSLTDQEKEALADKVFSNTGIPLSREDPIFALVEIIKTTDDDVVERVNTACQGATASLTRAAEHIEQRSNALESMVDSYIQSRIEAANTTLDIETKRLKKDMENDIHSSAERLTDALTKQLASYVRDQCTHPLREALEMIPQRSWLENVWTLAACLAIGFATGIIFSEGTLRVRSDFPTIGTQANSSPSGETKVRGGLPK